MSLLAYAAAYRGMVPITTAELAAESVCVSIQTWVSFFHKATTFVDPVKSDQLPPIAEMDGCWWLTAWSKYNEDPTNKDRQSKHRDKVKAAKAGLKISEPVTNNALRNESNTPILSNPIQENTPLPPVLEILSPEQTPKSRKPRTKGLTKAQKRVVAQEIVDWWKNTVEIEIPELEKLEGVTDALVSHIYARLQEPEWDIDRVLDGLKHYHWGRGKNDDHWVVSLSWLVRSPDNLLKVLAKCTLRTFDPRELHNPNSASVGMLTSEVGSLCTSCGAMQSDVRKEIFRLSRDMAIRRGWLAFKTLAKQAAEEKWDAQRIIIELKGQPNESS
jgi:hypothetical protein